MCDEPYVEKYPPHIQVAAMMAAGFLPWVIIAVILFGFCGL